jgi:hypothetical protein
MRREAVERHPLLVMHGWRERPLAFQKSIDEDICSSKPVSLRRGNRQNDFTSRAADYLSIVNRMR